GHRSPDPQRDDGTAATAANVRLATGLNPGCLGFAVSCRRNNFFGLPQSKQEILIDSVHCK
ncbi:MAG: hypothetical protein QMB52_04175, partial [Propionivibrio sp.]